MTISYNGADRLNIISKDTLTELYSDNESLKDTLPIITKNYNNAHFIR